MINFIKNFHADEDGAVTVDWVVLTAAVVGLGVAAVAAVKGGVGDLASSIEDNVGGITVTAPTALGDDGTTPAGG